MKNVPNSTQKALVRDAIFSTWSGSRKLGRGAGAAEGAGAEDAAGAVDRLGSYGLEGVSAP